MDAWQELGIDPTEDQREIKRAYARRLKTVHPEDDPQGFQRLRSAYEQAMNTLQRDSLPGTAAVNTMKNIRPSLDNVGTQHPPASPPNDSRDAPMPRRHRPVVVNDLDIEPPQPLPPRHRKPPIERNEHEINLSADDVVEELLAVLSSEGDAKAGEKLDEILKRNELANLDLRADFEETLLHTLVQVHPLPMCLVVTAAKAFGWQKHAQRYDMEQAEALNYLNARIEGREYRERFEEEGRRWWKSSSAIPRAITGSLRIWRFRWLALSKSRLDAMRELLQMLAVNRPEVLEYELDPQVVAWWQKAVATPRLLFTHMLLAVLLGPLLAAAVIVPLEDFGYISRNNMAAILLASIASISLLLGVFYGGERLQLRYREDWGPRFARWRQRFFARIRAHQKTRLTWMVVLTGVMILGGVLIETNFLFAQSVAPALITIGVVMTAIFQGWIRTIMICIVAVGLNRDVLSKIQALAGADIMHEASGFALALLLVLYAWWLLDTVFVWLAEKKYLGFLRPKNIPGLFSGLAIWIIVVWLDILVSGAKP